MKKVFIIIAILAVSAVAASAQTASKGEAAHRRQGVAGDKRILVTGKKDERRAPGVLRVGLSTTYLKNGLRTEEVLRFLGRPASISERRDGDLLLATYTFSRGEGRILVAEFKNGLLVSSRTETGQSLVQN